MAFLMAYDLCMELAKGSGCFFFSFGSLVRTSRRELDEPRVLMARMDTN
jgi:hypothetical protein